MQLFKDFTAFIKKNNALSLAVAVMIATSATTMTQSIVDNLINPVIDPVVKKITGSTNMQNWELKAGPFHLKIGKVLMALVHFLIVGLVIVGMVSAVKRRL